MNDVDAGAAAPGAGPLEGITVVDMTSVVFGPFATVMLADLGADVIKVESPRGGGEIMRHAGSTPAPGIGPIFAALNRNKRCIALDVTSDDGREVLIRLLRKADVFIHNVRMAGMARLGFDYEAVRAINSDIVYVHCAGFGSDGPRAGLPAYDDLIQCSSGFADLVRVRGEAAPAYAPSVVADKTAGLYAWGATLAALFHKQRTGQGQFVEVPMFEAFTHFNLQENLFGQTFDGVDEPMGYTRTTSANRKPFPTRDGWIGILPYTDAQWQKFFALGGMDDVFDDPRFSTAAARTTHSNALYALIDELAVTKTTEEWLSLLEAEGIPCARFNALGDLLEDEHLGEVQFFESRQAETFGGYRSMKHPIAYTRTPASVRRDASALDGDAREILDELGFSQADIDRMRGQA